MCIYAYAHQELVSLTDVLHAHSLCKSNTVRNIETIGLLGGSLSSDGSSFNITTLIIPKQKGETDRVEMLKEEEIWEIFFQVHTLPRNRRGLLSHP